VKRLTSLAVLVILIGAVPVFALDNNNDPRTANYDRDRRTVIDDVIKMSQSGVSDESIIRFVQQSRDRYVIDADTIIALNDAHVSKAVINALMDGAYDRGDRRDDRNATRDDRTAVQYVAPYPYYGYWDPYWSPYYYDPFWYQPRFSIGIGVGGFRGGFHGGGHRGHR
jgi:hypothetical protein